VTSSVNETVDALALLNAELFITGASAFTMTNRGVSDGTILVDNGSELNVGAFDQSATLTNFGNIHLNGGTLLAESNFNSPPTTVINNNVISGTGSIEGQGQFTLINEIGGVITGSLNFFGETVIDNSGTLESTDGGVLDFFGVGGLITINNTPHGVIEANGA